MLYKCFVFSGIVRFFCRWYCNLVGDFIQSLLPQTDGEQGHGATPKFYHLCIWISPNTRYCIPAVVNLMLIYEDNDIFAIFII